MNLRTEKAWRYNPSRKRVDVAGYPLSCEDYGETCSNTNHQYGQACTTVGNLKYCARVNPVASGAGSAQHYQLQGHSALWILDLNTIRMAVLLAQPVMISVDVTDCLTNIDVTKTNFPRIYGKNAFLSLEDCDGYGTTGSHAMLVVGYLSDAQLVAKG